MLKTLKSKTSKITQKIKDNLKSKQGSISVRVLSALLIAIIALSLCFFNPVTQDILLSLPFQVIKSVLFIIVLILASKQDLKEMQVSNWYSAALLAIGLIGVGVDNLIGGAVCYSVFFLVAMLTNLGGADVKIAGCCGFVLGTLPCLIALLIGLSISLILETITTIIKKDGIKRVYPLVPYIASDMIEQITVGSLGLDGVLMNSEDIVGQYAKVNFKRHGIYTVKLRLCTLLLRSLIS